MVAKGDFRTGLVLVLKLRNPFVQLHQVFEVLRRVGGFERLDLDFGVGELARNLFHLGF